MLNLFEAAKKSRDPLLAGIFLAVATSDELMPFLRFERYAGTAYSFDREGTLSAPAFVSRTHTSITEGTATFDKVSVPFRTLLGDADTYLFAETQQSELGSQVATQMEMKLKATGRLIAEKAIGGGYATSATIANATVSPGLAIDATVIGPNQDSVLYGPGSIKYTHVGTLWQYRAPGDRDYGTAVAAAADGTITLTSDNPNKWIQITLDVSDATADGETLIRFASTTEEPDGLFKQIGTTQTLSSSGAAGDALSFDKLDQLIDLVKTGGDKVFVMPDALRRKYSALVRATGGTNPEMIALPGFNNKRVPTYQGIPILRNDWIPKTESKGGATTLSSAALIDLGPQGFHAAVGGEGEDRIVQGVPMGTRIMGIRVAQLGELEDKEALRSRVSWWGNFALKSLHGAARAKELITA